VVYTQKGVTRQHERKKGKSHFFIQENEPGPRFRTRNGGEKRGKENLSYASSMRRRKRKGMGCEKDGGKGAQPRAKKKRRKNVAQSHSEKAGKSLWGAERETS